MYFNYFGGKFCGIDWKNGKTNFNIAVDFNINKSNEEKRKHQVAFSREYQLYRYYLMKKRTIQLIPLKKKKKNKKKKSKSKQSLKWGRCTMKSSRNTSDLKVQLRNLIEQFDE